VALRLTTDGVSVALNVYVPREVGSWTDVTSAIIEADAAKPSGNGAAHSRNARADDLGKTVSSLHLAASNRGA